MFRNRQQGHVLIVTLFVILVMGYLAASLMKVSWSNQSGVTREFLGTKAWFTAQSSNDWLLTQFFPVNRSAAVVSVCSGIKDGSRVPDSGLFDKGCQITQLDCQNAGVLTDNGKSVGLYVIKSVAICGSGLSQVQRQQEVWVRE